MAVNSLDGKLVVLKAKPEKLVHGACKFLDDQNLVNTLFTDIIDISSVTGMQGMFYGCSSLETVPLFDTSNVTNMESMFYGCSSLETVPLFDTSKVTDMQYMFFKCSSLTSVPLFDTSKVTNMANTFADCNRLTSVPAFDASKVTSMTNIFNTCRRLKNIHMYGMTRSFSIYSTALEHDALVEVLNNLGTAYNTSQTVTMGSAKLGLLSDNEKAIATNKGWQLE